ncbi:transcription factor, contains a PHD finger motif [Microbotryomycetes sp. JL221]|nr:transcription factor, contains a PHD finger motif [Microbotryomycetes sp. JL221]
MDAVDDHMTPEASTSSRVANPLAHRSRATAHQRDLSEPLSTTGHGLKRKHSSSTSATPTNAPSPALQSTTDDINLTTSANLPMTTTTTAPSTTTANAITAMLQNAPTIAPLPYLVPSTSYATQFNTLNHEFYMTRGRPSTRNGYRYLTCGPSDQNKQQQQQLEQLQLETSNPATTTTPVPVQRMIENLPQTVRFSWEDRSNYTLLTQDAKTLTAERGWRAARVNVPLRQGNWYWEIKAERCGGQIAKKSNSVNGGTSEGGEGSWTRIGVGRREAPLNAPAGFDGYSYAYRDKNGESVTLSRPTPYGIEYKSGDTIGVYLSLPQREPPTDRRDPARIVRKRLPIRYKGQLYFELLEYSSTKEMDDLTADPANKVREIVQEIKKAEPGKKQPIQPEIIEPPIRNLTKLEKSKLVFFVNGQCQGVAFENLFDYVPLKATRLHRDRVNSTDPRLNWHDDGTLGYYPFVSVFNGAIATINPGPDFEFPPPNDIESLLLSSPKPPKTSTIQDPTATIQIDDQGKEKQLPDRQWKPLNERYIEFLNEQKHLDELDQQQAIEILKEQIEKNKIKQDQSSLVQNSTSSVPTRGGKRSKSSMSSALASVVPVVAATPTPPLQDTVVPQFNDIAQRLGAVKDVTSLDGSLTATPTESMFEETTIPM